MEITVRIPDFARLADEAIRKANDVAIQAAANVAIGPLRANIPVKTGRMRDQTRIKYFRKRNGMLGASLQVIGDRHYIAHMLEYGTKSHGGRRSSRSRVGINPKTGQPRRQRVRAGSRWDRGPIPARHMFEKVWLAIQGQVIAVYQETFARELERNLR